MPNKKNLVLLVFLLTLSCTLPGLMTMDSRPLENINITIDPGHGDTKAYDNYRIGPTGEREEWINLRVAKILSRKLTRAGANVLMTRTKNKDVSLGGRAILASQHQSDLLVSIHHNASENDSTIDFPLVYFYGAASMNPASVDFANILINEMRNKMSFEQPNAGSVYSDHLIYNSGTSILRNSIDQMPGVIGEGGFFTNPEGERRLKSKEYNELEAEVYFQAIIKYFDGGIPTAKPLIPDTLDFLDFNSEIQFQLDDGFGNTFFEDNSFEIFQDGKRLNSSWDIRHGVLSAQPLITDENRISFQVLARNFKGNAIHPRPFSFYTEAGKRWYLEDDWFTAFRRADSLFTQFDSQHNLPLDERLVLLNEALHYYRLSLELQIVHPNALEAEKQVLVLLELKQELVGEDLQAEIEKQSSRLRDYYP